MKTLLIFTLLFASICFSQDAKDIIGKPIKIGNLLIAENDFPDDLTWDEAKKACRALGKGWRLPTKTELNILFLNRKEIGGFSKGGYWSSIKVECGSAWEQDFKEGSQNNSDIKKGYRIKVRAIMGGSPSIIFVEDAKDIIGKPIKIGNLLIAENDFPDDLTWDEAKKACRALGKGWRLPTKTELNVIFKNKNKIGGFTNCYYWSSTEIDHGETGIWGVYQEFKEGSHNETFKSNKFTVRAINVLSP